MLVSLSDYRSKLMAKIRLSNSQEEVKRYIRVAMKSLEEHQLNTYIIARFVDKMIEELQSFSPMNEDVQQWSNIKMAKISFHQIKRSMVKPAG